MRLTCHDCGSLIYISTNAPNCPECGADLESYLRALEYVRECYRQASEETLAGDNDRALAILAQGLSAVNASELHLLAALIHRKQSDYDGMRRHVAAIPVDDPLRPEGEWLLRSHQQNQRAVRQAQREYDPPAQVGKAARQLSPEFYPLPPTFESPLRPQQKRPRRSWRIVGSLLVLMILAVFLRQPLTSGLALLTARRTATPVAVIPVVESAVVATPGPDGSQTATVLITESTPLPTVASSEPTALPVAAANEPIPTPLPAESASDPVATASPVEAIPPSADSPAETDANRAILAALATATANRGNLNDFLIQSNRSDLADLPVTAVFQDGKLSLSGVLSLASQRLELLELAAQMPGVVEVDSTDLVVDLPATYVVVDGDTLWTIAYYLYGDGSLWEQLYAANQALLGPFLLIDVGMELQVPVLE